VFARILGTGSFTPERIVTNAELAPLVDSSDEWIVERTGIRERRWVEAGSGVGSAVLGTEAARRALADAGVAASEISLVIFATLSPDYDFPGNGVLVARELGLDAPATLDVRQQCNGFLYGMATADAFIRAGVHERVLVVAAEVQSTGLDVSSRGRDMTVIFADGAGAAVVGRSDKPGVLAARLHSDGKHAEDLWCEFPSSKHGPRLTAEAMAAGRHYPRMQGRMVFRHAVQRMPEVVREVCAAANVALSEIDFVVPHQANLRIIENVRETLGLPTEKVIVNVDRFGNTTAASIPLALDQARKAGRVPDGALVCLTAFGAGFGWGAVLVRI
jgi:3-oxoacyl-[acyl-carrier-protein] synthase-3